MIEQARELIERTLVETPMMTRAARAEVIARRLEGAGLLVRCSCTVGFGQGRDPHCPRHGDRVR